MSLLFRLCYSCFLFLLKKSSGLGVPSHNGTNETVNHSFPDPNPCNTPGEEMSMPQLTLLTSGPHSSKSLCSSCNSKYACLCCSWTCTANLGNAHTSTHQFSKGSPSDHLQASADMTHRDAAMTNLFHLQSKWKKCDCHQTTQPGAVLVQLPGVPPGFGLSR